MSTKSFNSKGGYFNNSQKNTTYTDKKTKTIITKSKNKSNKKLSNTNNIFIITIRFNFIFNLFNF